MEQLLLYFLLDFYYILLCVFGVKIELVIVFADTKLTAYALRAKLTYTDDLLW